MPEIRDKYLRNMTDSKLIYITVYMQYRLNMTRSHATIALATVMHSSSVSLLKRRDMYQDKLRLVISVFFKKFYTLSMFRDVLEFSMLLILPKAHKII